MSIEAAVTRISAIQSQLMALQAVAPPQVARTSTTPAAASGRSASGSFASLLTEALATQSSKRVRLNADGIPTELAAYGNGRVPSSALDQVGSTGHRLWG